MVTSSVEVSSNSCVFLENALRTIFMKINSHTYKILLVIILTIIFYLIPIEYLSNKHSICIFQNLFHTNCWGCGTTRAFWSILHLHFYDALEYNQLVIVTFPLISGCVLHWIFKRCGFKSQPRVNQESTVQHPYRYFLNIILGAAPNYINTTVSRALPRIFRRKWGSDYTLFP